MSLKTGFVKTIASVVVVFFGMVNLGTNVSAQENASANDRPNVIVIMSDDQGWGDFSCNGNTNLETPNIDSLARDGVVFDNFLVCPVCSPTRAEFLTGRYHPRGNVFGVTLGQERLDLDETTIADSLKTAGYATGAFGKWHNGTQYPYHPRGRGFDEFYGFCSGHWGNYFSPMLEHNGQVVKGKGYVANDFTDHAIGFIESNQDKPFFVCLTFNTPHWPPQVPDKNWDKFANDPIELRSSKGEDEDLAKTRSALAMVENIDSNVGRVLQKLDELRLAENTIVIYFNDNGPNSVRWNAGLRGIKGSTDEGGVRSPLFVRWPRRVKTIGKRIEQICGSIDLLPTLCEATSAKHLGGKFLDGVSLMPLLDGDSQNLEFRMIYSHWGNRVSVRTQQYRMDHKGRLYDLDEDPSQTNDVASQEPLVASMMLSSIIRWKQDTLSIIDREPKPFTVGHADFDYTHLPARDASWTGDIKRSSVHANCSFLTNWKSSDEYIHWPVDVLSDGKFEVELYYTCPKENVGAVLELKLGDESIESTITEAHDPNLVGPSLDKFERAESAVKDFKPVSLGVLDLKKGRGELQLRAKHIEGNGAVDFRLLIFKRVR